MNEEQQDEKPLSDSEQAASMLDALETLCRDDKIADPVAGSAIHTLTTLVRKHVLKEVLECT